MGGAIRNPKYNPGIDLYSGFRKTSQGGGGVQYEILKVRPPYLKTWIRHWNLYPLLQLRNRQAALNIVECIL